jgi:hypothetical protein
MSIANVTTALQVNATTGDGFSVILPEPKYVTFRITGNGTIKAGAITIEYSPQITPVTQQAPLPGSEAFWTALTTMDVPSNATIEYFAGRVAGTFRARISTPVSGGTVTVTAIRPEEQRGSSLRRFSEL